MIIFSYRQENMKYRYWASVSATPGAAFLDGAILSSAFPAATMTGCIERSPPAVFVGCKRTDQRKVHSDKFLQTSDKKFYQL